MATINWKPNKYKKCISYTYKNESFKLYYFYKNYMYIHICFVYSLKKLINIEKIHTKKKSPVMPPQKYRITENPGGTTSLRVRRMPIHQPLQNPQDNLMAGYKQNRQTNKNKKRKNVGKG